MSFETSPARREDLRIDPVLNRSVVSFEAMCAAHRTEDPELSDEQMKQHWASLKPPQVAITSEAEESELEGSVAPQDDLDRELDVAEEALNIALKEVAQADPAEPAWDGYSVPRPAGTDGTAEAKTPEPQAQEASIWYSQWARDIKPFSRLLMSKRKKTIFAPPGLYRIRHLPTGAKHWGVSSAVPLCSKRGRRPISEFSRDDSGEGAMCGPCVKFAIAKLKKLNAEEYVEGVEP